MELDRRRIEFCIPPSQWIMAIGEMSFWSNGCKNRSGDPRVRCRPGESCSVDWLSRLSVFVDVVELFVEVVVSGDENVVSVAEDFVVVA